tara:strand:+ start:354 stop:461 length:108 start_codon:yes stop_codon:yes gene_type:complete
MSRELANQWLDRWLDSDEYLTEDDILWLLAWTGDA